MLPAWLQDHCLLAFLAGIGAWEDGVGGIAVGRRNYRSGWRVFLIRRGKVRLVRAAESGVLVGRARSPISTWVSCVLAKIRASRGWGSRVPEVNLPRVGPKARLGGVTD